MTAIKIAVVLILMVFSVVSDIRYYKITNKTIFAFTFIGLAINIYIMGTNGLKYSLLGWTVPVAILFVLYALRMLGAGDIKLFGAIGAIMGYKFVIYAIAYSFLAGGLIGIFLLISRENAQQRVRYFFQYLKSCFLCMKLLDYSNFSNKSAGDKFRFSYAVFSGVLIQLIFMLS